MIELFFDGGCQPINPQGVATYGFVVKEGDTVLHMYGGVIGEGIGMTNNVAEYRGVIEGMKWLVANEMASEWVRVKGDSKLVIFMINKVWGHNKGRYEPHRKMPHLALLLNEAFQLKDQFSMIEFSWIPREMNGHADKMTEVAYEDYVRARKTIKA